jgi:DNA-binding CsgD family transcriptional regulator
MSILKFLKQLWMGSQHGKRKYSYDVEDLAHLQSPLRTADPSYDSNVDERSKRWVSLSPREQDVTALTCLRYTNPQIAARLGLSIGTVRSYLEKVLGKLRLQDKTDLRVFFAGWDFSDFERRKDPHR